MSEQPERKNIKSKEAKEALLTGKCLENFNIPKLEFQDQVFPHDIILENCRCESISFQGCTFQGQIIFKMVEFDGLVTMGGDKGSVTFEKETKFIECKFNKGLQGKNCEFIEESSWDHSTFVGRLTFPLARFRHRCSFIQVQFQDGARFEDAIFGNNTSFESAVFQGTANFRNAKFLLNAYFRKVIFVQGARFENTSFHTARFEDIQSEGKWNFKVATFESNAYFHRAQFSQEAIFRGIQAKENTFFNHMVCTSSIDFSGAEVYKSFVVEDGRFQQEASFARGIFHQDVILRGSIFEHNVDFQQTVFHMRLDCTKAQFGQQVILKSIQPETLILEQEQIEGKIFSEEEKDYANAKKVYVLLRRSFEYLGNHEAADWAYYKFRQNERKSRNPGIGTFLNWFFYDFGCGYGTKPLNVTFLAFLVIMSFTSIFWFCGDQFVINPEIRAQQAEDISFAQAFYISAMTFTTLGTEGIAPRFDNWLKYGMVIEGFLGLFLMTVFVSTYTRKMVK